MKPKLYTSAGLLIESDFDLPGISSAAVGSGTPHLRYVRATGQRVASPVSKGDGISWIKEIEAVDFTAPDVAEFRIEASGTVSVWPLNDSLDDVSAYLIGSVLGIALHLRKIVTLHASAIVVGDGAVLFCGPSGAGKSTMAAALHMKGYAILSDDLCSIEVTREGAIAHSDGRKLKLWDEAIRSFGLDDEKGRPVTRGFDKFFVDAGIGSRRSAPVRAVFDLVDVPGLAAPRITHLSSAEGASVLRGHAYRPFLVQQLKDEALYFHASAALLRSAGIYRLERARDFSQIGKVIEALENKWLNP